MAQADSHEAHLPASFLYCVFFWSCSGHSDPGPLFIPRNAHLRESNLRYSSRSTYLAVSISLTRIPHSTCSTTFPFCRLVSFDPGRTALQSAAPCIWKSSTCSVVIPGVLIDIFVPHSSWSPVTCPANLSKAFSLFHHHYVPVLGS